MNALICYPDDIDFRIHLRNEFVRHGLLEAIEVMSGTIVFLVISSVGVILFHCGDAKYCDA